MKCDCIVGSRAVKSSSTTNLGCLRRHRGFPSSRSRVPLAASVEPTFLLPLRCVLETLRVHHHDGGRQVTGFCDLGMPILVVLAPANGGTNGARSAIGDAIGVANGTASVTAEGLERLLERVDESF